jgi:hypothetical protein
VLFYPETGSETGICFLDQMKPNVLGWESHRVTETYFKEAHRDERRDVTMECYFCLVNDGITGQCTSAICQSCGAALCTRHVQERRDLSDAGGMAAFTRPPYRMICQRCYAVIVPTKGRPATRQQKPASKRTKACWETWWERLWGHRPVQPPESEDMISAVETFLKQQLD